MSLTLIPFVILSPFKGSISQKDVEISHHAWKFQGNELRYSLYVAVRGDALKGLTWQVDLYLKMFSLFYAKSVDSNS